MAKYRLEAVLEARADTSGIFEFQGALAGLEAQMAGISDEEITLRADGSQALAEGAAVRAGLEGIPDESIDLNVNSAGALAEAATVRAGLEAIPDEEIDIDVDTGPAVAQVSALAAALTALGAIDPTINIRVSFRALANAIGSALTEVISAIPRVTTGFVQMGAGIVGALVGVPDSLRLITTGLANAARGAFTLGGAFVAVLAAAQLLGSIAGILGSVSAILFGLVSIGGLFVAALVLGFGLVALAAFALVRSLNMVEGASQDLRAAWSDFVTSFDNEFVGAAEVFAEFSEEVLRAATQIMPQLGQASEETVSAMREAFDSLLTDTFPRIKDDFQTLLEGLPEIIGTMTEAIGKLGAGLIAALEPAMPVLQDLANYIDDLATRFLEWADSVKGEAAIAKFFDDIKAAMPDILEGIGSIVEGFKALADVDIQKFGEQFKNFGQGVEDVLKFVDRLKEAGQELADKLNAANEKSGELATTLNKDLFGGGEKNVDVFDKLGDKIKEAFGDGHPLVLDFFETLGKSSRERTRTPISGRRTRRRKPTARSRVARRRAPAFSMT